MLAPQVNTEPPPKALFRMTTASMRAPANVHFRNLRYAITGPPSPPHRR